MMKNILSLFFILLLFLQLGCAGDPITARKGSLVPAIDSNDLANWADQRHQIKKLEKIKEAEQVFIDSGMVNIQSIAPRVTVDLRYSGRNNLAGYDMYGAIENAYAQPEVAQKIRKADSLLFQSNPDLKLLILDAARPLYVQQIIWDSTDIPLNLKVKYLSNPKSHSIHNYGAAIDLTIIDSDGIELDMGTPYDFFGPEAHPVKEKSMLSEGRLTSEHIRNRKLLREVMTKAGFRVFPYEWWHFNSCTRIEAKRKYKFIP